ncbi:stationary-phase-induced ribosome-associated protein, partial [Serratia marcescens]
GPDPRNFNQRVSLGRNDLLIRTFPNHRSEIMIKAKSNRKARRLFGLTHWKSNKFRVSFTETADGGKWKVEKKKK